MTKKQKTNYQLLLSSFVEKLFQKKSTYKLFVVVIYS